MFVKDEVYTMTNGLNDNAYSKYSLFIPTYSYWEGNTLITDSYNTFTPASTIKLPMQIIVYSGQAMNNVRFYPMLYKGEYDSNKTYEPYGAMPSLDYPSEIHCLGDDVNLFNLELEQGAITGNGADSANNTRVRTVGYIELEKGTYAFSYSGVKNAGVYRYNMNNNFIDTMLPWTAGNFHFTITEKCKLRFAFMTDNNTTMLPKDITKIKLQKGSVVTPWSPYGYGTIETISKNGSNTSSNIVYVDKPLCSVGNVRDELDYTNKKIIRRFAKVNLKDLVINYSDAAGDYYIAQFKANNLKTFTGLMICNYLNFDYDSWGANKECFGCGGVAGDYLQIKILKSRLETIDRAGLTKFLNANDIIVVYRLANEIIEDVDCSDKITQYDEQTTVYNTDGAEIEVSLTNNKAIAEVNEDFKNNEIQTIQNEYGTAIKFPDGTMICTRKIEETLTCNNTWGNMYFGKSTNKFNFAQEFKEVPAIQLTLLTTSSSSCFLGNYTQPVVTTNSFMHYAIVRPTSAESVSIQLNVLAIGRWK